MFDLFGKGGAAFFAEFRDRQTDDFAVVDRGDTEIGGDQRLFNRRHGAAVPGLDDQHPGLRHGDSGKLFQTGRCSVVINRDVLHQRRGGFAGSERGKILAHVFLGLHHVFFEIIHQAAYFNTHSILHVKIEYVKL